MNTKVLIFTFNNTSYVKDDECSKVKKKIQTKWKHFMLGILLFL